MKNKKLLYVLLPVAALVWGLVIYQVVQSLEAPAGGSLALPPGPTARAEGVRAEPDTFRLLLNYRDPFLANRPVIRQEQDLDLFLNRPAASVAMPRPVASQPEPAPIAWPQVEYVGLIENGAKKTKVALVRVGEAEHLLREGQAVDGVKLAKVLPDSVLVEFKKERRFVRRN
jgi:hypothetical protein